MSKEHDAQDAGLPELPRVMRALREEGPGRARLDEIARRLGPVLDAPLPSAAAVGLFARLFKSKLAAGKFLAAVLTFGALATIAVWPERSPVTAVAKPHGSDSAPSATAAEDDHEAKREVAAEVPTELDAVGSTEQVEPVPAEAEPRAEPVVLTVRAHPKKKSARASTHTRIERRAALTNPSTAQANAPWHDALEATTAPEGAANPTFVADAQVPSQQEPEPEPAQAARPKSETDLIFEARTIAKTDPARALRLVDEHVQRFPDGLLAPEREVLAIEVLRRLGKHDAAAARLSVFRKRYPGSVHLRRLEGASL